jgi:hypothetical protein
VGTSGRAADKSGPALLIIKGSEAALELAITASKTKAAARSLAIARIRIF